MITHHIEACLRIDSKFKVSKIILLGFFPSIKMNDYCLKCSEKYELPISYLEEKECYGTAGKKFKNQIKEVYIFQK
jgi:hypothetical protein